MEKEFTCIGCPLGCQVIVKEDSGNLIITGNTCPRGEKYVRDELTNPTRMVTSMVSVKDGEIAVVSVKTKDAIPKDKIEDCIRELKGVCVKAPVKIGDVILENVAGTGIAVIATKNIAAND